MILPAASVCAATYNLAEFDAFIQQHPSRVERFTDAVWAEGQAGTVRQLTTTMEVTTGPHCPAGTSGGCGTVMERYVVQTNANIPPVNNAAVHKVSGGLITESIWYTNARSKALRVQVFYDHMRRCGTDSDTSSDDYQDPNQEDTSHMTDQ